VRRLDAAFAVSPCHPDPQDVLPHILRLRDLLLSSASSESRCVEAVLQGGLFLHRQVVGAQRQGTVLQPAEKVCFEMV